MSHEPDSVTPRERAGSVAAHGKATASAAIAVTAAVLVSLAVGGSARAAEAEVTCGSTVTTDVTLIADLVCASGDGIVLGTGVTLDLGGHRLTGGGSGVGVSTSPDSIGGNTIRNGTIENWQAGISLQSGGGPDPFVIADLALRNAPLSNSATFLPAHLTKVTAVDSDISGELGGDIFINRSKLTRSHVNVFDASATITNSTFTESPVSTTHLGQVIIESSRLDGNGTSAVGFVSETVLVIRDSVVQNYAQPISGFWGGVELTGNSFSNMPNGVLGRIDSGLGFDLASEGTSYIAGNKFTRSGVALRGNVPMIVEDNTFKQGETAVEFTRTPSLDPEIPATAERSRAIGNVVTQNSGTGILTELSGLEVGDNTVTKNGGYGIYAPGAVDLGGNVASRNALGQCVGVVCAAK